MESALAFSSWRLASHRGINAAIFGIAEGGRRWFSLVVVWHLVEGQTPRFLTMMKGVGVGSLLLAFGVSWRDKRRNFRYYDQIYGILATVCVQYQYYDDY